MEDTKITARVARNPVTLVAGIGLVVQAAGEFLDWTTEERLSASNLALGLCLVARGLVALFKSEE